MFRRKKFRWCEAVTVFLVVATMVAGGLFVMTRWFSNLDIAWQVFGFILGAGFILPICFFIVGLLILGLVWIMDAIQDFRLKIKKNRR